MSDFINLIMGILSIEISLGSSTFSLGTLLACSLILRFGYNRLMDELMWSQHVNSRAQRRGFDSADDMAAWDAYMSTGGDMYHDGEKMP